MKSAILALLLLTPALAAAQDNIVSRPSAGISPTQVQTTDARAGITNCLLLDGADYLDPANHFECVAVSVASVNEVTNHTVTVVSGGGHVTVRAVSVLADGTIGSPSPNFKKVLDVPAQPRIVK